MTGNYNLRDPVRKHFLRGKKPLNQCIIFNAEFTRRCEWFNICCSRFTEFLKCVLDQQTLKICVLFFFFRESGDILSWRAKEPKHMVCITANQMEIRQRVAHVQESIFACCFAASCCVAEDFSWVGSAWRMRPPSHVVWMVWFQRIRGAFTPVLWAFHLIGSRRTHANAGC